MGAADIGLVAGPAAAIIQEILVHHQNERRDPGISTEVLEETNTHRILIRCTLHR